MNTHYTHCVHNTNTCSRCSPCTHIHRRPPPHIHTSPPPHIHPPSPCTPPLPMYNPHPTSYLFPPQLIQCQCTVQRHLTEGGHSHALKITPECCCCFPLCFCCILCVWGGIFLSHSCMCIVCVLGGEEGGSRVVHAIASTQYTPLQAHNTHHCAT